MYHIYFKDGTRLQSSNMKEVLRLVEEGKFYAIIFQGFSNNKPILS